MAGRVNMGNILKKINKSSSFNRKVDNAVQLKFDKIKESALKEFDAHPITEEIQAGPTAENTSNTLGGYGNLFSFIGFSRASNPIGSLRSVIDKTISIKLVKGSQNDGKRKVKYKLKVSLPSNDDISSASPMPWEGGSWVEGVENGMSNFSFYMYKRFGDGRSGYGFQADHELRRAIFSPKAYITEILNNFRFNLKGIK